MSMNEKNAVSQFFYFMWNRWSKEVCFEIYGPQMGQHFWDKYICYYENEGHDHAVAKMYADMSEHYRDDLVNAALKYYKNK